MLDESIKQIRLNQRNSAQNAKVISLHSELVSFYEYILELVYRERNPTILKQLLELDISKHFPYLDTSKIGYDFKELFLDADCLNADLNTYWMSIYGKLSYILRGRSQNIPQGQIDWLKKSFFDIFKQYRFLEEHISKYPGFYETYINHEKARTLILCYLFLESRY